MKNWFLMGAGLAVLFFACVAQAQVVKDVRARQRYPWNNLVDINYTIEGVTDPQFLRIQVKAVDRETGCSFDAKSFLSDVPVCNGTHRITWNQEADHLSLNSSNVTFEVALVQSTDDRYLVIDLSSGSASSYYPIYGLSDPPAGGWTEEYKTNKLVLRKIPSGTFVMGSPVDEMPRSEDERQHRVHLSRSYYMGVFEVTQEQWKQVMGDNPSFNVGSSRPVDSVSYEMIRGGMLGGNWPNSASVDTNSFMGKIRMRTGVLGLDLPTEAQWEYACRAGTATTWYNGVNDSSNECEGNGGDFYDLIERLGRYIWNGGETEFHTVVGSYQPNVWGLYDLYGNVAEWCLDWSGEYLDVRQDPTGAAIGDQRILRGGSFGDDEYYCRSAGRYSDSPDYNVESYGFRLSLNLDLGVKSFPSKKGTGKMLGARPSGSEVLSQAVSPSLQIRNVKQDILGVQIGEECPLAYSSVWDGGDQSVLTISVNGKTEIQKSGDGVYRWIPTKAGKYEISCSGKSLNYRATVYTFLIKDIQMRQRFPWNHLVDIDYTIEGVAETNGLFLSVSARNSRTGEEYGECSLLTEAPVGNGRHRITWDAAPNMADRIQMSDLILKLSLCKKFSFAQGVDAAYLPFSLGGNSQWYAQTKCTHDGTAAGKSGKIGPSESSGFETTIEGPKLLSFWWKASSEGLYRDYMEFVLDGTPRAMIGGVSTEWEQKRFYLPKGTHTVRWNYRKNESVDAGEDCGWVDQILLSDEDPQNRYLCIDLSSGPFSGNYPISYLEKLPDDYLGTTYKTDKLLLRKIPAGSFVMGSPEGELGRSSDEKQRFVTLTHDYYIGVFEITQRQWELVMGDCPAKYVGPCRPVEQVSYLMIRGNDRGFQWPLSSEVDASSFVGRLRSRTGLSTFDLPTEAQWEYACRAGTITGLNNGREISRGEEWGWGPDPNGIAQCPYLSEVGRYSHNLGVGVGGYTDAHTEVGSYRPNEWGLYDMHGNVWEWCLDWYSGVSYEESLTDPAGSLSGNERVTRGGSFSRQEPSCRSAARNCEEPGYVLKDFGFRIAQTLPIAFGTPPPKEINSEEKDPMQRGILLSEGFSSVSHADFSNGICAVTVGEKVQICYSDQWNGGTAGPVLVTADGSEIYSGKGEGTFVWSPQRSGVSELTHTSGGDQLFARFFVMQDALEGESYSFQLQMDQGKPPYQWRTENLPEGFSLSPEGVLSSSRVPAEIRAFDVVATDANGKHFKLHIPMRVLPPSEGMDLVIHSQYAGGSPVNGAYRIAFNSRLTLLAPLAISSEKTKYHCVGWSGTGSIPTSGTETNVSFTLTEDSSITWNWQTNYWLEVKATEGGSVNRSSSWMVRGDKAQVLIAQPTGRYSTFRRWIGDTDGCSIRGFRIFVPTDRPRSITADFSVEKCTLGVFSEYGIPSPTNGLYTLLRGREYTGTSTDSESHGTTNYSCIGWTGTGSVPARGDSTNVTFTLQEDSSLVWNWQTNHWIDISVSSGKGAVDQQPQWLAAGEKLRIEASPGFEQQFSSWEGDLEGCEVSENVVIVPSTRARTIHARFERLRHRLTVFSNHGNPGPANGLYSLLHKTDISASVEKSVMLGETTNYLCTGWSGTGSVPANGTATNLNFILSDDSSLVWNWQTNYWLDVKGTEGGKVDSASGWITCGAPAKTLTAIPEDAYCSFYCWLGDTDGCTLVGSKIVVPSDRARRIVAQFSVEMRELTVVSRHGHPAPASGILRLRRGGTYIAGNIRNDLCGGTNYVCFGWSGTGSVPVSGTGTNLTFTLLENSTLIWNWQTKYRLEVNAEVGGKLDNPSCWVTSGESEKIFTAIPENQYCQFKGWIGDTKGCQIFGNRIFVPGDRARRITATFSAPIRQLIVSSEFGHPFPTNGLSQWVQGSTIKVSNISNDCQGKTNYLCTGWSGTGSVPATGSGTNLTFSIVQDSTLTWHWQTNYWIDVKVEGLGEVDWTNGWVQLGTRQEVCLKRGRDCEKVILEGDLAGVSQNGDSLSIPSDRARTLVVRFLPLDLHFALDAEELEWETGGDAFWIPQRTVSHDGHDAAFAESVITDDEDVWLATRVFGSGKFNFFLKSGEFLGDFSGIDLFVDGQWVDELSGFEAFDWKPFSVDVKGNGEHTIAFSVWTDGTAPSRSVWIDQVSWMTEGGGTTTETPVPVPYTWLEKYGLGADGDYNSAANGKAANGQAVWACYEAGLDPTDPNARLRARIEMREGRAVISWEPDLGAERVYRVEGAEALGKPWKSPPEAKDRFFRVKVRLP